jgi:hypothetical protein
VKKVILSICLLHLFILSFSQEIKKSDVYYYARKIVDTLASPTMYGRGYINEGDRKAAEYIRNEFESFGLKPFDRGYFQKFDFPINTFQDSSVFLFGLNSGKEKFSGKLGQNYLISADAPEFVSDFKAIVFDSSYALPKTFEKFSKRSKGYDVIIVDDRNVQGKTKLEYFKKVKANYFKKKCIIELEKKLTWHQSQRVSDFVSIQILADSFSLTKKKFRGSLIFKNTFIPEYLSQNVIAYIPGTVFPDSFIVFSAHYDHLGGFGKETYFPGANDNASGTAMLLNLARYYSRYPQKYSIAFMAFGAEEVGLVGSKYYTEHPFFPLKKIKFVLNMDIMGTGEEGITVVNGSVHKNEFEILQKINNENELIKDVRIRGRSANSDHYYFSENNVKAFFIYSMGGIKAYHDIYDRAETLPLNEIEDLFKLIVKFGDTLQKY